MHQKNNSKQNRNTACLSYRCITLMVFCLLAGKLFAADTFFTDKAKNTEAESAAFHARGVQAFKEEQYGRAVFYLEQAFKIDRRNARLVYNLASAYYKNNEFNDARTYYKKLVNHSKYQYTAYYNLGLVALKLERYIEAETWFEKCLHGTADEALKKLSATALQRTSESDAAKEEKYRNKQWRFFISTTIGQDDNVSLSNGELDFVSHIQDTFSEISVSASGHLFGNIRQGVYASAGYDQRTYSKETDYDFSTGVFKLAYDRRIETTYARFFGQYEQIDYSGEEYQRVYRFGVGTQTLAKNQRWLKFNFQHSQHETDNALFKYLEGDQLMFSFEVRKKAEDSNYQVKYQVEKNDRNDLSVNNQFFDASPVRHTFSGRVWFLDSEHWNLSADFSYRKSIYDRFNVFVSGNSVQRDDDRYGVGLLLNIKISRHWSIKLSHQYLENDSNIAVYSYQRNISKASLGFQY